MTAGTAGAGRGELSPYDHSTLKSLLGAWALAACSRDESLAVEVHLTDCAACADEALRLRDAVGLLHQEETLDLDPLLRSRVLSDCLDRRPARVPMPRWAAPYDAETARLDALLRDLGDGYWDAPVELRWYEDKRVAREVSVAQVIGHLCAVDGLVASALGLPLDELPLDPAQRTESYWATAHDMPGAPLRTKWREQGRTLVRTVSFAGHGTGGLDVGYGGFTLPLRDAFLDRAFECWIHAWDIAEAVDYPYDPPAPRDLHPMIDLAARMLPTAIAGRRRAGLAASPARLTTAGSPGRSVHLEVEGLGGGDWYIALDSPGALATAEEAVAHVALDSVEFCQLAAGHLEPERIAVGQDGDRGVIRDVLFAAASLSRL
ncbi:maleylpyruvate isomerase N-terminal domain-containing protein [Streptomyces sp. H39-S7]|uniref:maleylpyruvate isomerase N-terminal domain-containing protein n=1 Tax=Streptomyces sp. H39-S7 TaxID=3004357 RepID=UPI0022AFC92E|nr:maleylpyruvate isomerase N-terminal domain-containing protein [Streptomyces sp. H39-S7]MCZ4118573.1 maleylpyruvate isomerase N-terminal domain-containing protein [Streptomyces sp. H39-S7]